jgi:hypothetical protein
VDAWCLSIPSYNINVHVFYDWLFTVLVFFYSLFVGEAEFFIVPWSLMRRIAMCSQRSSGAVNARGSLMSQTSASMQSNATPNSLDKECSPPVPPPSSPPLTHDDSRDIMDYGNSGDDDDESTQDFDAVAMDDSEAHMDLTDDLLHKVGPGRYYDVLILTVGQSLM